MDLGIPSGNGGVNLPSLLHISLAIPGNPLGAGKREGILSHKYALLKNAFPGGLPDPIKPLQGSFLFERSFERQPLPDAILAKIRAIVVETEREMGISMETSNE